MTLRSRLRAAFRALSGETPEELLDPEAAEEGIPEEAANVLEPASTTPLGVPAERYYPWFSSEAYGLQMVDDLVQVKGLSVYRDMVTKDDQVASCVSLLIFSRLASGWEITPASGDAVDKEIATYVRFALDRLQQSSFHSALTDGLDAIPIGFSVLEPIWAEPGPTPFGLRQGFRAIRPLPQETITLKRDAFGLLEPDGIWQAKPGSMVVPGLDPSYFNHLPADRFVVFSWLKPWDNPLGRSVLRAAYRWYFGKDVLIRKWLRYQERFGLPLVKARLSVAKNDAEKAAILEALRLFQTEQVLLQDPGVEVDVQTYGERSAPTFRELLGEANRGIGRACLTPATLSDQPEVGAYSLGESQRTGAWFAVQDHLGHAVEERLARPLFRMLVDVNYGRDKDVPALAWKPYSDPDRVAIATMLKAAKDLGIPVGVSHVQKVLGLPEPEPGEPQIGASTAEGPLDGFPPPIAEGDEAMNALFGDLAEARQDPTGDAWREVLAGNGPRSRAFARDEWQ